MSKKYTIEDFKEMFDKAKKEVIKKETIESKEKLDDPLAGLMFSMVSLTAIAQLEKKLFGEDKDNE